MSSRGNSLKNDFGTKVSKISESCRYPTILVEGRNDQIIYEDIFGDNSVTICHGKDNIVKELKMHRDNKIAIVDADYDDKLDIDNLFYTDYNDLECMAINLISDRDFCKYIKVDKEIEDIFLKRIYYPVLKNVKELSSLWKFCNNNKISFLVNLDKYKNRENVLFRRIVDLNKNKLKYDEICDIYKDININIFDKEDIGKIIKENADNSNNFRGHDFFSMLYFYIYKKEFKLNINMVDSIDYKLLEEYFIRESAKDKWIKKSKVYKDVKNKFDNIVN